MKSKKRILLVDLDDTRRKTRVQMLTGAGYAVETRSDHELSEALAREGTFDLLVIAIHRKKLEEATAYSERLRKQSPTLPILLLVDAGVFVPHGTLSTSIEPDFPLEVMREIAEMLAGSAHIREIPGDRISA